MEEIFVGKRKINLITHLGNLAKILTIAGIITIFFLGVNSISKVNIDKQEESLRSAMERDIVQCYSLEGVYPPSLEYLETHYGLVYDKDLFFIDYRPVASNIYPDVTVLRIENNKD